MDNFLILDTETTGLGDDAEIVEIAVIDRKGKVLLDTLVKPLKDIPAEATNIHGITTEEARRKGRDWLSVLTDLITLVQSGEYGQLNIYNSAYDLRLIKQSTELRGFDLDIYGDFCNIANDWCVMQDYANFYRQPLTKPCPYTGRETGYKWQSLVNACKQQDLPVLNAHRALADCQMTLNLINWMDQVYQFDLPFNRYEQQQFPNNVDRLAS